MPEQKRWSPPSLLAIFSLCLCYPVGLVLIWACPVHSRDGSTWSLRWKTAYTLAFILPFVGALFALGLHEGVGIVAAPLAYLCVICVAITDAIYHRRRRTPVDSPSPLR